MLYLIGLGLADEKDITVRGLEAIRECDKVYLEAYTSVLGVDKAKLEAFYEKPISLADREFVELDSNVFLNEAQTLKVAFLVVGDPFGATTHTDLYLRAVNKGIAVSVIHNASIVNAIGACGLQLYHYGPTVSIPFFTETWRPASFYGKIQVNQLNGQHTLCLLDIKVKEQSEENLFKGKKIYEPARFMTCKQAAQQLLQVATDQDACQNSLAVAIMRVGSPTQKILAMTLAELATIDDELLGPPLHSLVLPGKMHELEFAMLKHFALPTSKVAAMQFADLNQDTN